MITLFKSRFFYTYFEYYNFFFPSKVFNLDLVSPLIDWPELGKGPRSITKIGLHTHTPPTQTFIHEGEVLGVPYSVFQLY